MVSLDGSQSTASLSRRRLLQSGGFVGLAGAMAIESGGRLFSSAQARAQEVPLRTFTAEQAAILGELGDVLLPGAKAGGVVEFIDHQLTRQPPLLIVRYFDWPGDLTEFYTSGLEALDAASNQLHGTSFLKSTTEQRNALAGSLLGGEVPAWDGPPPPLYYLAVRSDAVDVVYGTVEGFDRLNIPYMPHIAPQEKW